MLFFKKQMKGQSLLTEFPFLFEFSSLWMLPLNVSTIQCHISIKEHMLSLIANKLFVIKFVEAYSTLLQLLFS